MEKIPAPNVPGVIREEVVAQLIATGKWAADSARLGERAEYRCESCGLDLLASAEAYKQWQIDHVVPRTSGGDEGLDNLAIACKPCNFDFKRQWDPRTTAGRNADRSALIRAVKDYIKNKKAECREVVASVRKIVGRPPLSRRLVQSGLC